MESKGWRRTALGIWGATWLAVAGVFLVKGDSVNTPVAYGFLAVGGLAALYWLATSPTVSQWVRSAWSGLASRSPIIVRVERRTRPTAPPGERGYWDFKRDGERALAAMVKVLDAMTAEGERNTKKTIRNTKRLKAAARRRNLSTKKAYALHERTAKDIDSYAARMERLEERYRKERVRMIENFLAWRATHTTEAELAKWRASLGIDALAASSTDAREATEGHRDSVREMRQQNVARPVNEATDRLVAVLTKQIENIEATEAFCREVSA